MRVAVVTPYYKETDQQLDVCMQSVSNQTYPTVSHIMVADGHHRPLRRTGSTLEHIVLPNSHGDAGATPRAIGALSAFSRGFDAVAFLDADNWYEPNHIELMVNTMAERSCDAVIATRTMYSVDGNKLYVDLIESNGENMVDTNCMFLSKKVSKLLSFWITDDGYKLVSDRVFWNACAANGVTTARCDTPTVSYVTRWAWHYQYAGVNIPDDAVWLEQDTQGNFKQHKHKDRRIP